MVAADRPRSVVRSHGQDLLCAEDTRVQAYSPVNESCDCHLAQYANGIVAVSIVSAEADRYSRRKHFWNRRDARTKIEVGYRHVREACASGRDRLDVCLRYMHAVAENRTRSEQASSA